MSIEVLNSVRNWYGPRGTNDGFPANIKTLGKTKEMTIDISFDNLPTASEDGVLVATLPADAYVIGSRLHVKTAAVGGTSYTIGFAQPDGTAIDADGLHTAAQLATAALLEDAWLDGGGALVGASIGANAGQVVMAATGTYTAGEYQLVIEYQHAPA